MLEDWKKRKQLVETLKHGIFYTAITEFGLEDNLLDLQYYLQEMFNESKEIEAMMGSPVTITWE